MKVNSFPGIPDKTAEHLVSQWLNIIKRQECGIIIFPPKGDAYRRIEQLLVWKKILRKYLGKTYRNYKFVTYSMLPFAEKPVELILGELFHLLRSDTEKVELTPQKFVNELKKLLEEFTTISFFLYDTDPWFLNGKIDVLTALSTIAEIEPRIQFLLFCETDITSPVLLKQNVGRTTLVQNLITVPLYSPETIEYLIGEFGRYWEVTIPISIRQKLIEIIGCHTWLIKEAVRIYVRTKSTPESFVTEPTMRVRLEAIWQQFTPMEQAVLLKLVTGYREFSAIEKNSLEFFKRLKLLEQKENRFNITLPILAEFLKEKQFEKTIRLGDKNEIYSENEIVTQRFGPRERGVLIQLLLRAGSVVTRSTLAQSLWGRDDYSDWALDRVVSRVRSKLRKLGVDPERIKTVKKVGFLWQ